MQNIHNYDVIAKKLRNFFQGELSFTEVPSQSRLSILAACEDPRTISSFMFGGVKYPLPQTGQMWLEYELLKNPGLLGVFCQTTSYRDEQNPIPGRHDKIFPMFEFESKGGIETLKSIEAELLKHLGFRKKPITIFYEEACKDLNTDTLEGEHEEILGNMLGSVISLEIFPQRTHPFWNMKHNGNGLYNKVDVLLHGMETIGSAERSTNVDEMRNNFLKISSGRYAGLLFREFGKERVMEELENYLSLPMFPRFGGGIGMTRLERAAKLEGLLK